MCLIAFALDASPRYRLLLAANRDEFHDRPALAAHWWNDQSNVYGGRDLNAGGTWLALDRSGRLAAVTNFRERPHRGPGERSRGELGASYLGGRYGAHAHASRLLEAAERYAGFSLLLFDWTGAGPSCVYLSNRDPHNPLRNPEPGIHTLSNHLLDTRWPKTDRLGKALDAALDEPDPTDLLFDALADRQPVSGTEIEPGVASTDPDALARPPFIFDPLYGTRASTVVAIRRDGSICFVERSWQWGSNAPVCTGERRLELRGGWQLE